MRERERPSRRAFLAGAAGTAAVAAAGGVGYQLGHTGSAEASSEPASDAGGASPHAVPFYGEHQGGIATPAQDRVAFAAFDVTARHRAALAQLLGGWSAAAARLTAGQPIDGPSGTADLAPADTGEVLGLSPSRLTITVGFGSGIFDGRFGLSSRRPAALEPLPHFPGDILESARSGGDLCVQACADDPQVAFHAIRNFARIARGTAVLRWSQLGFGRTSSTSADQQTPRNLMGFKDGTNNVKAESADVMNRFVWVGDEGEQNWMRGGTYLVARRIRMLLENWDAEHLSEQEGVFGRSKAVGAPLTGQHEFDAVDLAARGHDGKPVIRAEAHIRLAAPETNAGEMLLRRGYSYTDGIDARTGQLDAGLFFVAFQKDPRRQFVPIQRRLAQHDALNEYIRHTGSALFAVPPGVSGPGDWFGQALFS